MAWEGGAPCGALAQGQHRSMVADVIIMVTLLSSWQD